MGRFVSKKSTEPREDEEVLLQNLDENETQSYVKPVSEERAQWSNSLEFVLATVSLAIGLGNVWRFPFLVFKHGGTAFLVPFIILLFIVGIPIFLLETALGQFSGLSPTDCFEKLCPLFQGLGYTAATINLIVGLYYNVIIAYCIYYLFMSVQMEVPWKNCEPNVLDCFTRSDLNESCDSIKKELIERNISKTRSPSEVYFYDNVLELTSGIENLGGLNLHLTVCLILAWMCVFMALLKGVQSLGKVSYFTATFPMLMLTILVVQGFQLAGCEYGIQFYIGKFDIRRMYNPRLWMDACVQIFYAISSCCGGLISMSSFNNFDNNVIRDAFLVPILDIFTGFYAGFAIFTVLGNMYLTKCVDSFMEVAAHGPELAFVVYPEGLSLMGKAAPVFSVFFFFMMLALGFGSEFSMVESSMSTILDMFKGQKITAKQTVMARLLMCSCFCVLGLFMTTRGGFFILNLIDSYIAGYPLLFVGLLETIIVGWIYGADRFCSDVECMIGKRSRLFWWAWKLSWKYLCPLVLAFVILASFYMEAEETNVRGVKYPASAKAFGSFAFSFLPLCAIPWCMVKQLRKHKFNLDTVLSPDESYYDKYKRFMRVNDKIQKINQNI